MRERRHPLVALLIGLLLPLLTACSNGLPAAATPTGVAPAAAMATATNAPTPAVGTSGQQAGNAAANVQIDPNASISGNPEVQVGSAAPDFNLPGADGTTYSLSGQRGKVVVLEFIATWCPHCQNDAPMMNQLYNTYKSKNVAAFAINATPEGHDHSSPARMSDLRWFHDTYSVAFPMLFDKSLKSANDYGVAFYPSIYIIDQQGKVAFQPPDNQIPDYDLLAGQIDKLLSKGT